MLKIMIRHCIVQCLTWDFTVCLRPIKGRLFVLMHIRNKDEVGAT